MECKSVLGLISCSPAVISVVMLILKIFTFILYVLSATFIFIGNFSVGLIHFHLTQHDIAEFSSGFNVGCFYKASNATVCQCGMTYFHKLDMFNVPQLKQDIITYHKEIELTFKDLANNKTRPINIKDGKKQVHKVSLMSIPGLRKVTIPPLYLLIICARENTSKWSQSLQILTLICLGSMVGIVTLAAIPFKCDLWHSILILFSIIIQSFIVLFTETCIEMVKKASVGVFSFVDKRNHVSIFGLVLLMTAGIIEIGRYQNKKRLPIKLV